MGPQAIADALGRDPNNVRSLCKKMADAGTLDKPRYGKYIPAKPVEEDNTDNSDNTASSAGDDNSDNTDNSSGMSFEVTVEDLQV